ncbi:MAG: ROK family protein [Clostridia bacterium]|nr:ROK family protein [Clostridia bacterium]
MVYYYSAKIFEKGKEMLLGFDIGGTKCAVITAEVKNETINIINKEKLPTDLSVSPETMIGRLMKTADKLIENNVVTSVGISCGGPLDSKRGIIISPPNLIGWENVAIVDMMEKHFGIPVYLQNDANACALAEWKFGAGRGCRNMVFLTFGTGLGAGLILDGKLYCGTNDNAGETGHIRLENDGPDCYGKPGSFEGFCSGAGIAKLGETFAERAIESGVKPLYFDGEINAKTIADAAEKGDKTAIDVYKHCGYELGKGLSIIIDLLNPEKIVIGSIFARSKNLIWEYAKEVIEKETLFVSRSVCEVLPAALGEKIGDYAAIGVALSEE